MNNKKRWVLALLILMFLGGCHKNQKLDKPENLISRDVMVEMMADSYILESMIYIAPSEVHTEHYSEQLYAQMLKKYNVTKETFVASLIYYLGEKDMATAFLQDAAELMTQRRNTYYTEMHDAFVADSLKRLESDSLNIHENALP